MSVVHVRVENKRGLEQMLNAFRRACKQANILDEWREHQYYEKPSDKRRKKIRQRERENKFK